MSKIEKIELETVKWLKMIFKLRNKDGWGHFFFVGTSNGSDGSLAVTISSKDPKGTKAGTQGKMRDHV